jgi:hypothetical protein
MRDHLRLRSRIAILAGLAAVPLAGCNPPPKPEKTDKRATPGADGSAQASGGDRTKRPLSPTRLAYYEKKAAEQGVPLSEVVPDHFELPAADTAPAGPQVRTRPERFKTVAGSKRAIPKTPAEATPTAASAEGPPSPSTTIVSPPSEGPGDMIGFPGDPPFIDGYNPEEASCPSGNWCGDKAAAGKIGIVEATDDSLGCPARIGGTRNDKEPIAGKAYAGLSTKPNMQGAFNEHGTELARAAGEADTCCYHWFEYCSGRPHVGEAGPIVAAVVDDRTGAWTQAEAPPADLEGPIAERIAELWRLDALAEHASIASFARATLELMAVGAPADLLTRCQQAGLDEVDHARRCFALAAAYGGPAVGPGPLPALAPRATDLVRLAVDTFSEGCAGETVAALVAERSARDCDHPAVVESLLVIADDEARHAALAWATVRWAVETGGDEVRTAVLDRAAAMRPTPRPFPAADPDAAALARAGRLDARAQAHAHGDAWREIIDPLLASLTA